MNGSAPCRRSLPRNRTSCPALALVVAPVLLGLLGGACRSSHPWGDEPDWPRPQRGMVVSEHPLATEIGLAVLGRPRPRQEIAAGDLVPLQQMGFGLAVAVFLDATIVRSILVPAAMRLMGDLNWYLPQWLEWLPQIDIEGHDAATQADGEDERDLERAAS